MQLSNLRAFLTNFEVYLEGTRLLGEATVDLPELKFSTQEVSGAGITGKIDFPAVGNTDSIEVTLNWRTISEDMMKLGAQRSLDLALYGAQHIYNHSSGDLHVEQVKIELRGLNKSQTLGKFEPSSSTDSKTTLEVIYMKISIDGKKVLEIDKLNYVYFSYDKDYLADTRAALGLDDGGLLSLNAGF